MPTPTNVVHLNLSVAKAREILHEVAKDSARVFFSPHAEKQMRKRRINRVQVLRCLANGQIKEGPACGIKGNWELAVEALSAGDVLHVAAALDQDDHGNYVIIITAYYL
ncbi:MAG: DUF4258 domain-containing protein [Gammaproteobacteria bacterium]|nr:DUF4258 domain-containing protein [Gammaproteobacteria bacterium]